MRLALAMEGFAVQQKSSANGRMRGGAGRSTVVLVFRSLGTIVITHTAGTPDLLSTIDRTRPVTVEPAVPAVAVLPLNWAIRKRRTSFGSLVSNVNTEFSLVHATMGIQRYPTMKIVSRRSTATARLRAGPHRHFGSGWFKLGERRRSVAGIVDILKPDLPEKIADDADHGA
jgi:hypothetical protein